MPVDPDEREDLIQFRRDVLTDWEAVDPVLAEGEPGLVLDPGTRQTVELRFGDGTSVFTDLPSFSSGGGGSAVLYDFDDPFSYTGTAEAGTLTSANEWRIVRMEVEGDGTVTVDVADPAVWDDRVTETYA